MSLPPALIERFTLHLQERLAEVRSLEAGLPADCEAPADVLAQLKTIAHKLAGTAEGYGFGPLGSSARALDATLRQIGVTPHAVRASTGDLLNELQRAVGRKTL